MMGLGMQEAILALLSWAIATAVFLAWRKVGWSILIYLHLFLLVLPAIVIGLRLTCGLGWYESLSSLCTLMWLKLILYLIPMSLAVSFIGGYFVVPQLHFARLRAKQMALKQLDAVARKAGNYAQFFWFDSAAPLAFSSRKKVFLSQGLFEVLSPKELEAVILHEMYHVRSRGDWRKFSLLFNRAFSPFAGFARSHGTEADERAADAFAERIQGTTKHVRSARRKILRFEAESL